MNKQISLSGLMDELSQARTKKKELLEQMDRLIPWGEWEEEIRPCYYKGERGNKPYPLEIMLRLYLLQNLYDLSDEATAAEAIDSRAFSDFCGVDSSNQVPDGNTIGRFRNLLIKMDCSPATSAHPDIIEPAPGPALPSPQPIYPQQKTARSFL